MIRAKEIRGRAPRAVALACAASLLALACSRAPAESVALIVPPAASAEEPEGGRLAALEAALAEERAGRELAEAELQEARDELTRVQALRIERELDWIAFNHTVSALDLPHELIFRLQGIETHTVEEGPPPEEDPRVVELRLAEREAAEARTRVLRGLLRSEAVAGFEPLELGVPDGRGTGPVVFRLLNERGRLAGSIAADHLHLEASLSGRTVTLVFEDGHESHGGLRTPFADGERRVLLPHVDPTGWIEALPELFAERRDGGGLDDGLWDAVRVRAALNLLLERDGGDDHWTVRHVSGVHKDMLTQVHLTQYHAGGAVRRQVFADRLRLTERASGIELVLEDGVTMHGDTKAAFLNGVFRIRLPRADSADWRRQDLPGLRAVHAVSEGDGDDDGDTQPLGLDPHGAGPP